jgi:hypothetical protein
VGYVSIYHKFEVLSTSLPIPFNAGWWHTFSANINPNAAENIRSDISEEPSKHKTKMTFSSNDRS